MSLFDFLKPKWRRSDPQSRISAIAQLQDLAILTDLADNDPHTSVRDAAFHRLDDLRPPLAEEMDRCANSIAEENLKKSTPHKRWHLLSLKQAMKTVKELARYARSRDERYRTQAIDLLIAHLDKSAKCNPLVPALGIALAAANLGEKDRKRAANTLMALLRTDTPTDFQNCPPFIATDPDTVEISGRYVKRFYSSIAQALVHIGYADHVLNHSNGDVCTAAAHALARLGNAQGIELIAASLVTGRGRTDEQSINDDILAIHLLGSLGKAAIPYLVPILKIGSCPLPVLRAAATALNEIETPEAKQVAHKYLSTLPQSSCSVTFPYGAPAYPRKKSRLTIVFHEGVAVLAEDKHGCKWEIKLAADGQSSTWISRYRDGSGSCTWIRACPKCGKKWSFTQSESRDGDNVGHCDACDYSVRD